MAGIGDIPNPAINLANNQLDYTASARYAPNAGATTW